MAILLIGDVERKKVEEALKRAKARPTRLADVSQGIADNKPVLTLKDREKLKRFVRPKSEHINFPGGYRAAISFEEQPIGMCSHLSVSVEGRSKPGMMPSPEAVEMICDVFGVPFPGDRMWTEEYEPGEFAINLVSVTAKAGHA